MRQVHAMQIPFRVRKRTEPNRDTSSLPPLAARERSPNKDTGQKEKTTWVPFPHRPPTHCLLVSVCPSLFWVFQLGKLGQWAREPDQVVMENKGRRGGVVGLRQLARVKLGTREAGRAQRGNSSGSCIPSARRAISGAAFRRGKTGTDKGVTGNKESQLGPATLRWSGKRSRSETRGPIARRKHPQKEIEYRAHRARRRDRGFVSQI